MMMRRYEGEEPAPFRVLSPGGRILYEPQAVLRSPPPARAPEPYKVAPQASSYGRTQRKSSFAIIAETRPSSPLPASSRPGSPTQLINASGRLSPFRGRGFKGPPPRSHSRPQSPPPRQRASRYDRRGSISQQSSPKRSQIPRPARSRSISSSKEKHEESRKGSPKFGRRAANRYTSSIGNNNAANQRRMPQKDAKRNELSPIQGTPTKPSPDKSKRQPVPAKPVSRGFGAQRTKSPEKINRNLLAPPKNVPGAKRFVTAKPPAPPNNSSSREGLDSPSKIPMRRGSLTGNSTSMNSLAKPATTKSTAVTSKNLANKPVNRSEVSSNVDKDRSSPEAFKVISSKKNTSSRKDDAKPAAEEDLGLVDLLKQSSGATGTSSVVNTTTTTAVQPLQIDAASILSGSELAAKLASLEKKQRNLEIEDKSPESQKSGQSSVSKKAQEPEAKASPSQSTKGDSTTEDKNTNDNLTQTMIKHFGQSAVNEDSKNVVNNSTANQTKAGNESSSCVTAELQKAKEGTAKLPMEEQQEKQTEGATSGHKKTDSKASIAKNSSKSNSTNDSKKIPSRGNSPISTAAGAAENQSSRAKRNNEASLKSQAQAVSSESLGSLRSTDTGVSLNTVRGVSSAKEKTGLHLVKRPEEIETLSGNVVQLESNGERALPAADDTESKAETRWQRLRSRCCPKPRQKKEAAGRIAKSCWPKMRCLACRRDPKAQLWPGKQARAASSVQLTASPQDKPTSRWTRLKEACRCARTREGRWFRRGRRAQQQVAPAEVSSVAGLRCCQPERRLGALCRGLFSRCRRRSQPEQQRRRSVRAKHSLTSVAAPPLSEETRPKIPDVLVEHNSVMRGAIPCLPVPIAWFCLVWNVLLPGSGTILSGLFNLCAGQPRFSASASPKARFGALVVNLVVGLSQFFTVLFCLVGWGWSIWWGATMIRLARKYKRFKVSEAAANDPEVRGGPETATLPAPGVPTQALRGLERPR